MTSRFRGLHYSAKTGGDCSINEKCKVGHLKLKESKFYWKIIKSNGDQQENVGNGYTYVVCPGSLLKKGKASGTCSIQPNHVHCLFI